VSLVIQNQVEAVAKSKSPILYDLQYNTVVPGREFTGMCYFNLVHKVPGGNSGPESVPGYSTALSERENIVST
jgi:hypothetical protein